MTDRAIKEMGSFEHISVGVIRQRVMDAGMNGDPKVVRFMKALAADPTDLEIRKILRLHLIDRLSMRFAQKNPFIASAPMPEQFDPPGRDNIVMGKVEHRDNCYWTCNLATQASHILIFGSSGSGKTSLLHWWLMQVLAAKHPGTNIAGLLKEGA